MDHSAILKTYFENLPELDKIQIIKAIIEKYENSLTSVIQLTAPTPRKATVAPSNLVSIVERGRKDKKSNKKPKIARSTRRLGALTVNNQHFASPGKAFKELGLNPSNWYAIVKGMNIEQIQDTLSEYLLANGPLEKAPIQKPKVIRRKAKA
ncbi:MAG TPA: hypothetical protein VMW10_13010 [Alphaproteobacteria bacterium]|nr:hypothetical protein [Alphaproteobacteria bacterium]